VGDFDRSYLATKPEVTKDFVVDDVVIAQLRKYLDQQHIKYTAADIQDNLPWLKWEIKREVFTSVFGLNEGFKVELQNDVQLDKAEEMIPQARALYENARKIVAERQATQGTDRQ
jgi:carboxyl-terminal processing protease